MTDVIVDTNVAVIANRQNDEVIPSCVDACVVFLKEAYDHRRIIVDEAGEVIAEYVKALRVARPYQLGALFLLHVQREQYNTRYVRRVDLAKTADGDFLDLPKVLSLAAFDRDDHKFAALSARTGVAVTNATDTDWADHRPTLNEHGVSIEFLCGCDRSQWFS